MDRPTVANAETTSNTASRRASPVSASSASAATPTAPTAARATATAWRWTSTGTRRPNATVSRSPRISAHITSASTTKVPTLMPPAVLPLPPPMSISA